MKYYNPLTQQKMTRDELKRLLNASFPQNTKKIMGWYLLTPGVKPEIVYGQGIVESGIVYDEESDSYIQSYEVVGTPQMPEETVEDRLDDIEDALIELAGILFGDEEIN